MGIFLSGATEKRSAGTWTPEPPIPPYPGADAYGNVTVTVKPDVSLTVPAVWACVGLLANTVASLPLQTYRQRKTLDVPERIEDPKLVQSPSGSMAQSQWLHMVMVSLLLRGNAYGLISQRDSYGYPSQVDLLNPDDIHPRMDPDTGRVQFVWKRDQRPIPAENLWHLPGLMLPGTQIGLSPITYAAATLGIDISSRQFANQFFDGGGIPKAVLQSDQPLNQEQARTAKERFLAAIRGREPMVLGAGLQYTPISVRPEESQFLATQQANVAQVARYFWVPPELVGASGGNSMTYANVEQRNQDFLTLGLAHWLKRIEDGLFRLLPRPQYVEFDTEKLLRTDAETTAKIDLQMLAGKVMAPSEIRQRRGLPPMTQAQKEEVDLVPLTETAVGGVRLPQGAAKTLPGPNAPVPLTDQQALPQLPPQLGA